MTIDLDCICSDPNWSECFRLAMERGPSGVPGYTGSVAPFTRDNIAEVIAAGNGMCFGPAWIGAFRLNDGRFAFVRGTCDVTTGNGCDDWDEQYGNVFAEAIVASAAHEIVRFAMGDDDRRRLGLRVNGALLCTARFA